MAELVPTIGVMRVMDMAVFKEGWGLGRERASGDTTP